MSACLRGTSIRWFRKDDILSGLLGVLDHCLSFTAVAAAAVS